MHALHSQSDELVWKWWEVTYIDMEEIWMWWRTPDYYKGETGVDSQREQQQVPDMSGSLLLILKQPKYVCSLSILKLHVDRCNSLSAWTEAFSLFFLRLSLVFYGACPIIKWIFMEQNMDIELP